MEPQAPLGAELLACGLAGRGLGRGVAGGGGGIAVAAAEEAVVVLVVVVVAADAASDACSKAAHVGESAPSIVKCS